MLVHQERPSRRPEGGPCVRQSWDPNPASLTPKSMFLNHHRMPLLQNISKEKGERNEKSTKYLSHALPYLEPLPPSGVTSLDSGPRDGPSEAGGEAGRTDALDSSQLQPAPRSFLPAWGRGQGEGWVAQIESWSKQDGGRAV